MDLRLPADVPRRPEPASAKRAQVEREVLDAVDRLLQEGVRWADLSIERIATAAGISRTAFYFYFKDKREVLMRLLEEVGRALYATSTWLNSNGGRELLPEAMRRVHEIYENHGALLQAVLETSMVDERAAALLHAVEDQFVVAGAARMAALDAEGEARPIAPFEATARALVVMTEQTFYSWRVRGEKITPEHLDALSAIWVRSIYGSC